MDHNGEDVKLDYNLLLLKHLDRLSVLSTSIQGSILNSQGHTIHWKEKDRGEAFDWGVRLLDCVVPDDLKDQIYQREKKEIDEWYDDLPPEKKKSIFNLNKLNFQELTSLVNLLSRKGYLYQNQGMMKLQRPDNEEWDQ